MNASNHGRAVRVAYAIGGAAAVLAVSLAAREVSALAGGGAGAALVAAVFVSCWLVFGVLPARHPAPARRRSRGRDPEMTGGPVAMTESQEPAQLAA